MQGIGWSGQCTKMHVHAGTLPPALLLIGDSTDRQLVEEICPERPLYFADEVHSCARMQLARLHAICMHS